MGEPSRSAMTIKVRAPAVLMKFAYSIFWRILIVVRKTFILGCSIFYNGKLG
ncbi:MAG: hypothetical protein V3T40_04515 [Nitrososphaerales archaeon]